MKDYEKQLTSLEVSEIISNKTARNELKWLEDNDVNVIKSNKSGIMEYNPDIDSIIIGNDLIKLYESGDNLAPSITLMHEATHARHMHLTKIEESTINDEFITALSNDPVLKSQIGSFREELYKINPGYLSKHSVKTSNINFVKDGTPGLKDNRTVRVASSDGEQEIYLSAFVSEFIAYCSSSQDPEIYTSATGTNRQGRELVKLAKESKTQILEKHPKLVDAIRGKD